jgi:hypothetical protein
VADQGLEFTTERVALDPIDHETTVTSTSCHSMVCVNEVEVVADILPTLDQVVVGIATCWILAFEEERPHKSHTPVVCDHISQLITKAGTSSWIRCNHHVSLVSEGLVVPSTAPGIAPRALWTTVNVEKKRV